MENIIPLATTSHLPPSQLAGETVIVKVLEYIPSMKTAAVKQPVSGVRVNVYRPDKTPTIYRNVIWTHKVFVTALQPHLGETVIFSVQQGTNSQHQKYLTVQTPSLEEYEHAKMWTETHSRFFKGLGRAE